MTLDFAAITATGKDKPGLVAEITDVIARMHAWHPILLRSPGKKA